MSGEGMRKTLCGIVAFFAATACVAAGNGGTPLFDGKSLKGWKQLGGAADYRVIDGTIVGSSRPGVPNSFLVTLDDYDDFILEFDVRQDVGPTNSGVQIRSLATRDFENGRVHGYQVDIDPSPRQWSGGIYEEAQRGWFYTGEMNPPAKPLYKFGQWNHYRIEAIGPRLRTWINGAPVSDVIDDATRSGFIGLQVHSIDKPEDAGRTTTWKNLVVDKSELRAAPPMGIFIRNNLPNNLDPEEKAQGWRLLWDGKTAHGWRGAKAGGFPAQGWTLANGELAVQAKGGGGDIMTDEEFAAFELQMEFKVSAGANSGIFYYLTAANDPASNAPLGLEYQVLDDERHPDAKNGIDGNRTLASLYDLLPRAKLMTNVGIAPKIDVWQHARIVARADGSVEHWLNGVKVLEFRRGSDDFRAHVAASKFKNTPGFGEAAKGRILLQDHGDAVAYRSIKIRAL
jgi:3-keto-disaccharide hydrolase